MNALFSTAPGTGVTPGENPASGAAPAELILSENEIAHRLEAMETSGAVACAAAFRLIRESGASPAYIGNMINRKKIKIIRCQLGIFGYELPPRPLRAADNVTPKMESAIRERLVEDRLPCRDSWEIAEKMDCAKLSVSSACEYLKIKISQCQLGAF